MYTLNITDTAVKSWQKVGEDTAETKWQAEQCSETAHAQCLVEIHEIMVGLDPPEGEVKLRNKGIMSTVISVKPVALTTDLPKKQYTKKN